MELRNRKDEEDEARNLIEEMERNLDDAQNKSYEVEQELNRICGDISRQGARTSEAHNDKTLADDAEQKYEELVFAKGR